MTRRILTPTSDTIKALHKAKAHLVLCRGLKARKPKAPLVDAWQRPENAPTLGAALHHVKRGGLLGFLPGRSELWIVDVDKADAGMSAAAADVARCLKAQPIQSVRTLRGVHLYYRKRSGEEIRNRAWNLGKCSGELRGDSGYVVLWDADKAASAIEAVSNDVSAPVSSRALPSRPRKIGGPEGVAAASNGARNDTLNANLFAEVVRQGKLPPKRIQEYRDAALAAGLDREEAERTIASAVQGGLKAYKRKWADPFDLASMDGAGALSAVRRAIRGVRGLVMVQDSKLLSRAHYADASGLWVPDLDRICRDIDATTRKAATAAARDAINADDQKRLKQVGRTRHWVVTRTPGAFSGMFGAAADLEKVPKLPESVMNANRLRIGVANGVLDIEAGKLLPRREAMDCYCTADRALDVTFDPGATHPAVDGLLEHLPGDVQAYLWRCMGRALRGLPESHFFVLVGLRDSGKTSLLSALQSLGASVAASFGKDLAAFSKGREGPNAEAEALVRSRFAVTDEGHNWKPNADSLKAYSGGGYIAYQGKYKAQITLPITATILVACNAVPRLLTSDDALMKRLRVVNFPSLPSVVPEWSNVWKETGDTPAKRALLARLVSEATQGRVDPPASVRDAIEAARVDGLDAAETWLDRHIVEDQDGRIGSAEAWNAYRADVADAENSLPRRKFTPKFKRRCGGGTMRKMKRKGKHDRGYRGFRLRYPGEVDKVDKGGQRLGLSPITRADEKKSKRLSTSVHPSKIETEADLFEEASAPSNGFDWFE